MTDNMGYTWDADTKTKVLRLYAKGNTAAQIHTTLGIPKSTILYWARGAKITRPARPPRRISDRDLDAAHEEYLTGESAEQVAHRYALSMSGLLKAFRRRGLRVRGHSENLRVEDWIANRALAVYLQGKSAQATGRRFGISAAAVIKIARRAKSVRRRWETNRRVGPKIRTEFFRLIREGYSMRDAGRRLNLTRNQTYGIIRSERRTASGFWLNNRAGGGWNRGV